MRSFKRLVAAGLVMVLAGSPVVVRADDGTASVQEEIAKAMPEADDDAHHKLEFGLELFDAVHTGLAMFMVDEAIVGTTGVIGAGSTAGAVGVLGIAAEVAAPVAAEAAVLLAIGNAHAEAINSILDDQIRSGFSRGVVLGADDRPPSYVKENFVKFSPVSNAVYPEYGKKFQNAYNRALVAGYAQGRKLLEHKDQRSAFFEDLYARMRVHPAIEHGEDQDQWSDRTWVNYYIDCAATFRATHLK
jgi:hypothetical protein